jgi:hypothetical protein
MTGLEVRLGRIERLLIALIEKGLLMTTQFEALQAEVARNTSVDQSAIVLLTGLARQIEALKGDPVELQVLADSLKASSDALAAAVAANTVAAPAEPALEPGPT